MPTPLAVYRSISLFCAAALFALSALNTSAATEIAPAINSLGLGLYREQIKSADGSGVLLSPYSIATALAMTYAGADGATKEEMEKVLHLPGSQAACGVAFNSLATALAKAVSDSEKQVATMREHHGNATPVELSVANRLFVQPGYSFRSAFLDQLHGIFNSDLAELDFKHDEQQARQTINQWVADQTHDKIRDILPANQPVPSTQLVLINALYLRAGWADAFHESATQREPFHFIGKAAARVPTMRAQRRYGYAKCDGYSVVTLPYFGRQLQFVLLVPDEEEGLASLEKSLTPAALTDCARLKHREVILHLPKFKLEPATMPLASALQSLGLRTAFDQPQGSANFDRMAPRKPNDYLYIGDVFHKTWLTLDEHGTEAAAATAVAIVTFGGIYYGKEPPPIEVRADRPFMFAIQHMQSGTCLFLGRVMDPR